MIYKKEQDNIISMLMC